MHYLNNSSFLEQKERSPILVEIVPPPKEQLKRGLDQHKNYLERLFQEVEVDAINIPEIQDESQKGEKGKRTTGFKERESPRNYARILSGKFDTEFIINRVVVKKAPDEQEKWILETYNEYNIKNFVFVGGESPEIIYPGPTVPEANKMAKHYLNQGNLRYNKGKITPTKFNIGNICIPNRVIEGEPSEAERMLFKLNAGVDFFTTQIITEEQYAINVLKNLSRLLKEENITKKPAIFWSFSPISSQKDIDFLRWLGVYISENHEENILNSANPAERSLEITESVWDKINDFNRQLSLPFTMGINISVMGKRNYENGIRLAKNINALPSSG